MPMLLFVGTCLMLLIQTMTAAYVLYPLDTFITASVIMVVAAGLLLRRFLLLKAHVQEATRMAANADK